MIDDISSLVNETFEQTNTFSSQTDLTNKSGIIYHVDSSGHTFCTRMMFAKNLSATLEEVASTPENYPSLRLLNDDEDLMSKIGYFVCNQQSADQLKYLYAGKRFPSNEEEVLNVSDPGYSLWLKEDDGMEIFFKLSHVDSIDSLIKLGPIAMIDEILPILRNSRPELEAFFDIQELVISPVSFKLKAMKTPLYHDFVRLVKNGCESASLKPFFESSAVGTVFQEMATARKFWLQTGQQRSHKLSFLSP